LIKGGIAASASLIGTNAILHEPLAAAEDPRVAQRSTLVKEPALGEPFSPRQRLLLDFGWRFHLGNADLAANDFSYGLPAVEGTFAKSGQIVGHNNVNNGRVIQLERDDSGWKSVDLPHDWAIDLPFVTVDGPFVSAHAAHGGKPLGRDFPETSIGWYRRRFDIPAEDKGMRISLEFDGVFRDCFVVLNGFYLGRNFSGYAPFRFDVTDFVEYGGTNLIEVRVDATLNEGWYYEGAGIYRHTWLTKARPLQIAQWGTCVRSELRGEAAEVTIETEVLNEGDAAARGHLVFNVFGPGGEPAAKVLGKAFEIAPWGSLTLEHQVSLAHAKLWSLDAPNLYRVVTQIESDDAITDHDVTTFGIRSIRFDPSSGFFLNETHVKIKGTCNHQDHAGVGIGVPDLIHHERVAALKKMGSNGWRAAHNTVATELLDACDQQGMLVMAEARIMSSSPEGLSELERMVRRDRNHPSIVIWSLANEEHYQGNDTGARIVTSMKRLCKRLDPTRPVTGAMNGGWGKGISAVVDVQGFNYWNGAGEDGSNPARNIDEFHRAFPRLPTIGTETANAKSARGIYQTDPARGYVGGYPAGCEECKMPAEVWWAAYEERPFLSGGFTWVGFDYRGEPKPYDHVAISSQSGILDTCGFPKDIYYYYKSWWGKDPVLHIFPHWNWAGKEGRAIDVRCYSNLDSVELFVNGVSAGVKSPQRNSHLYWSVVYAPGAIEARGMKQGKVVLTVRRETTGAASQLALIPSRTAIRSNGEDVSSIAVEVRDSQGRLIPTASNYVQFSLTGAGKIIGIGNGDPSCREADRPASPTSASRSAFSGQCMVFVQATKQAGTIELRATGEGLASAVVTLTSTADAPRPAVA
jgi:beta-galactosidase